MLENLFLQHLKPWAFMAGNTHVWVFRENIAFIRGVLNEGGYKDIGVSELKRPINNVRPCYTRNSL